MKAVYIEEFGDREAMIIGEQPKPEPGPGEVRLRITHAAVNPVDYKIRQGHLTELLPHAFPIILGWDAAGVIDSLGAGTETPFAVGDRVYAYCRKPTVQWGAYAEYIVLPASFVAQAPKNLNDAQAAAIPLVGLTSWQSLFDVAKLQAGETVLIHAGAGGTGSMALQFARHRGARVITTASSKNHEYTTRLGADHSIDYRQQDFVAAVKDLAPEGVDVVYDTMGGETQEKSFELLKPEGRMVSIVAPPPEKPDGPRTAFHFVEPSGKQLDELRVLIEAGKLQAPDVSVMPLEQVREAHEKSESHRTRGKLVLKVS